MIIRVQYFGTHVTDTHWLRANDGLQITQNFSLLILDTGEMVAAKRDLLDFEDGLILVPLVNISAFQPLAI